MEGRNPVKSLQELTDDMRALLTRIGEIDDKIVEMMLDLLADAYAKGWEDSRYS